MQSEPVPERVRKISELSNEFHAAGVLHRDVILEIYRLTSDKLLLNSVETGCGKSTLLFSQVSSHHKCFTYDDRNSQDGNSLAAVQESPLFNSATVEFILGPTQKMLPGHVFSQPLQLVFIDGPHGFPFPELEYYFLYPHLEEDGLLILDDIHIPTIATLNRFLQEDEMFTHLGNVRTTSFFKRTAAPVFDPCGDGWWLQEYNKRRFPAFHVIEPDANLKFKTYVYLSRIFGKGAADGVRKLYQRVMR